MTRVAIGSSDFSPQYFTQNDVEDDLNNDHFDDSLTHDEELGVFDLIKRIESKRKEVLREDFKEMKVLASVWTPPMWMMDIRQQLGPFRLIFCIKDDVFQQMSFVNQLIKWIKAFQYKSGVKIYGISPQNEPFIQNPSYGFQCNWLFKQQFEFLDIQLGPYLEKYFDIPPKIIAIDDNKDTIYKIQKDFIETGLSKQIQGIALHFQKGSQENLVKKLQESFNKPIFGTESSFFIFHNNNLNSKIDDFTKATKYFNDIKVNFLNGGVAQIDWNILLDQSDIYGTGGPNYGNLRCNASTHVDKDGNLVKTIQQQIMKHFSGFLDEGDYVTSIDLKNEYKDQSDNEIDAISFKKLNGDQVQVIMNQGFQIKNVKIIIDNRENQVNLNSRSINTIVIKFDYPINNQ